MAWNFLKKIYTGGVQLKCVTNMKKENYSQPEIVELGLAKDIIKDVFAEGTGDSFPGTENVLASS